MSSDLIYREDAKDYARHALAKGLNVLEYLDEVPTADFRPVVSGKWEQHFLRSGVYADLFWHCSVCGYKNADAYANIYHNFCPKCGADMRQEKEGEGR